MSWMAAATIGSAVIGGAVSNNASKGAKHAAEQEQGRLSAEAARVRAAQIPFTNASYSALDQINALLGLTPHAADGSVPDLRETIREQLKPQYTGAWGGNGVNDPQLDAAVDAALAKIPANDPRRAAQPGNNGTATANALQALQNQPGYQFGLTQGVDARERGASSAGNLYSGATQKALERFGQDYANTKMGETYNRLASVAGLGQTALGQGAAAGQNATNNSAGIGMDAANFQAGNMLNQGNIWGNALKGLSAYGQNKGGGSGVVSGGSGITMGGMSSPSSSGGMYDLGGGGTKFGW